MIYLLMTLYVGLNALAPVLLKLIGSDIPHDLLIFMSTLYTIVILHIFSYKSNKSTYKKIFYDKTIRIFYWQITIITMFMWIGGFIIPIYYTPFDFVLPYLAWPGLYGALYLANTTKHWSYKAKFVLISFSLLIFYIYFYQEYTPLKSIIGILATFSTGSLLFLYFRISFKLNGIGFSPQEIMTTRFWLLLLIPLSGVIFHHEFAMLTFSIALKALALGLITLVIPLYSGQLAIGIVGSEVFSIIIGITPFVTIFLQHMVFATNLYSDLIISFILFLAIVIPYLSGKIKHKTS